jgi:O-acetyl-ADP-ribose deacetylase (regulator of RNase III)
VIRYVQGDILEAHSEALVNTVNCVGVMGRGIALQFKPCVPHRPNALDARRPRRLLGHERATSSGAIEIS